MKGIILAGGLGLRLRPLTLVTNKHLLPVYDRPMIYYPIQTLLAAGIDDILIVTGGDHAGDVVTVVRNGHDLGVRHLEYAYQEGEGGIADALLLGADFAAGQRVCVMLGDNLVGQSIAPVREAFERQASGARLLLKHVDDPRRFGVAELDGQGRIVGIVEKPDRPASTLAVTGIYFYDADVFDLCARVQPSVRGEREITDVNNAYLARGDLAYDVLEGWWADAGTFDSLYRTSTLVAEHGVNRDGGRDQGVLFDNHADREAARGGAEK